MTEQLKGCPFCGGKARIKTCECDDVSFWQVTCGNPKCFCSSALFYSTREEAVAAWNSRPIEDALQKELDEAREDNADNMEYHVAERERLKSENARLRKALFFYAELDGIGIQHKSLEFVDGRPQPFGTIARTALLNFVVPDGSRVELSKLKKAMEGIGDGKGEFILPLLIKKGDEK